MNFKSVLNLAASATFIGSAQADFSGAFDPALWAFDPGPGGSLVHTSAALILTGGDIGFGGFSTVTITAPISGVYSFDWHYSKVDSAGFDLAYYMIDDQMFGLVDESIFPHQGSISVKVAAGQTFGFAAETLDGIFGPGFLTITNFSAPLPAPTASLLLLGFGLRPTRQRQGGSAWPSTSVCCAQACPHS